MDIDVAFFRCLAGPYPYVVAVEGRRSDELHVLIGTGVEPTFRL
jgi:hypothetical protein